MMMTMPWRCGCGALHTPSLWELKVDLHGSNPNDRLDGRTRSLHQLGRILSAEDEAKGDLPIGVHLEVADATLRHQIDPTARMKDAGQHLLD
jgi:hypothetical protein